MSHRLRPLAVLCCAAALAAPAAFAQQPANPQGQPKPPAAAKPPAQAAQPLKDPVVATVNGQPIRLSELEVAQQSLPQQYRSMPLQAVFPALLDRIIDSKLVVQEGKKTKVTEDPAFKKRMAFVEDQVHGAGFELVSELTTRTSRLGCVDHRFGHRIPHRKDVHQTGSSPLGTTKYCAMSIIGFVAGAELFIMSPLNNSDDRAGGVFMGILITFGSIVIATAAAVFEKLLHAAVEMKSENDLTV